MRKEQVRSLEDQFSSLFRGSSHQQSVSETNQTNLLDSHEPSQQFNSVTFKQVQLTESESEEEEDFLDQVDGILGDGEQNEGQLTRRQIMLNYKVNELKLTCKNLKLANRKLAQRIDELQKPRSDITDPTPQISRTQDLTLMQQQFTQIEEELASYKQQLAKYQQQMATQLGIKNEEIARIKHELSDTKNTVDMLDKQLRQKNRVISLLEQRNEELLLAMEEMQSNQEQSSLGASRQMRQSHFNDKISQQMEAMIDKLLKELKYQKRNSSKQLSEIKRLNTEVIDLENKIKQKNSKVYQLQLNILKINKSQSNNYVRERSSPKQFKQYEQKDQQLNNYLPQRGISNSPSADHNRNKTQANLRFYNKNRISAQREGAISSKINGGSLVPLSKVFSTFTLMDLLNREFKIRTAEKFIITSRVIQLYANKLQREDYSNLISEQIQVYNFHSQNPSQLKVRINILNRNQGYDANEESMLYNMAFVLDSLLNQVQVLDAYLGNSLQLNITDYIQLVLSKSIKEEKYKLLIELSSNIEREYTNG